MEMTFDELMKLHGVQIYTKYLIKAVTANRLLGGWPKDPNVVLAMLEARYKKGFIKEETIQAARAAVKEQSSDDHEEEAEKALDKSSTGFRSDDNGIFIESRQIKAAFKETATTLGLTQVHRGVRQILQHGFFVRGTEHPDRVYLYMVDEDEVGEEQDQTRMTIADGREKLIAHIIGPQGPRSTIKFHDYVEPGIHFEFAVWFAEPKAGRMNEKFLAYCMRLIQDNGLGCSRSQGYGRIKFLTIEKFQDGVLPKAAVKVVAKPKVVKQAEVKKAS